MKIRKIFKFESAHIVRDCSVSRRCSSSFHGHSYTVEVILKGSLLDKAGMILDFGNFKRYFKDITESFDHCILISKDETDEVKDFFSKNSERVIYTPFNTSAEEQSIYFFSVFQDLLSRMQFNNGEGYDIHIHEVIVHETLSGYACAEQSDVNNIIRWNWRDVVYSDALISEWYDKDMLTTKLLNMPIPPEQFYNPTPIKL